MSPVVGWPAFDGLWRLAISDVILDGSRLLATDPDSYRLELHDPDWNSVSFHVKAVTTESVPDELGGLTGYALLTCHSTNTRIPFALRPESGSEQPNETVMSGEILLDRFVLNEVANLAVEITATHAGRARVVGRSHPWTLALTEGSTPSRSGIPPIGQVWTDFTAPDAPAPVRRTPHAKAMLELSGEKPTLYLNSGIPGFQTILTADNAKLERRRIRDLLGAEIAHYATRTLFRAAAAIVVADGEGGGGPTDQLLRNLCESVAKASGRFASVEELYDALVQRTSFIDHAELWADLDSAIDTLTNFSTTAARVTGEVQYV